MTRVTLRGAAPMLSRIARLLSSQRPPPTQLQTTLSRLLLAALALTCAAFSSTPLFDEPSAKGGGGGYAFTGAPTSHGMSCATCHQGRTQKGGVDLWSVPQGLFDVGYEPGTTYQVHVRLQHERRGLDRNVACAPHTGGCNRNGFVAEMLDGRGGPVGALCVDGSGYDAQGGCDESAGATTALLASKAAISGHSQVPPKVCSATTTRDCVDVAAMRAAGGDDAAISAALAAAVRGRAIWAFQWRAPDVAHEATLWLGAVDGDGAVSVDPSHNDFGGDEVLVVRQAVWARGHAPEATTGGCDAAGPSRRLGGPMDTSMMATIVLLAAALLLARRARAATALLTATLATAMAMAPSTANAADTSCDITTGASCLWGEGCDCDHDGYVRDTGKSLKYCHFTKCPLDSNDNDATKLGKVSTFNADGDGWTTSLDCDDKDPCLGKTCDVNTCVVVVDNDKDGFAADQDCDDDDKNVYPNAPIACCNCAILSDPAKAGSFGCGAGCPLSKPAPDASGTDANQPDTAQSDATQPDTAQPDTTPTDTAQSDASQTDTTPTDTAHSDASQSDTTPTDAAHTDTTPTDSATAAPLLDIGDSKPDALVGGGQLPRSEPPPPGCSASPAHSATPTNAAGALATLLLAALLTLSRPRRRAPTHAATQTTLLLLAATTLTLSSCATVKPWQRGRLAHRCMVFGADAGEQTLEQHAFQYREGAAGGLGGGGGGCGCN
jgi:hypothetical protein